MFMPKAKVNYALAATLVASGVSLQHAAEQSGAKNANTLAVGLRRKGVTATQARLLEPVGDRNKSITFRLASQASEILRKGMGDIIQSHTNALSKIPSRANLKHIRAVGDALEPLARTAKIVHDWGNTEAQGMILVGDVASAEAQETTIDIPSTPPVVVSEPIPEQKQID